MKNEIGTTKNANQQGLWSEKQKQVELHVSGMVPTISKLYSDVLSYDLLVQQSYGSQVRPRSELCDVCRKIAVSLLVLRIAHFLT